MPRSQKVTERKATAGVKSKRRKSNSDTTLEERQAMVAEAAYFRAQQRNFIPGFEEMDWIEAEKEIDAKLANH